VFDAGSPSHTGQTTTSGGATAQGVRRLIGPVYAHILDLDSPTRYEGFATFCCGDPSTYEAVQEVQRTAQRLYTGTTEMTQTPVIVEDASGQLIGYCSVHRRPRSGYPDGLPRHWIAERYIVAFGRDTKYHKRPLRDGTTYVGEILVRAGLDMIALETEDKPMPSVSALVKPENVDSHRIFSGFDFQYFPMTSTGLSQDLRWRDAGIPLPPPLDISVYVPPKRAPPAEKVGRNDPCTCESGKKYKKCCGY
jgi:hypothetical protein